MGNNIKSLEVHRELCRQLACKVKYERKKTFSLCVEYADGEFEVWGNASNDTIWTKDIADVMIGSIKGSNPLWYCGSVFYVCYKEVRKLDNGTENIQKHYGSLVADVPNTDKWRDQFQKYADGGTITELLLGHELLNDLVFTCDASNPSQISTLSIDGNGIVQHPNDCFYIDGVKWKENISSAVTDVLKGTIKFYLETSLDNNNGSLKGRHFCLFFIPTTYEASTRTALIIPAALKNLNVGDILQIRERLTHEASYWLMPVERHMLALETQDAMAEAATHSAIGSIMSRNGSHNIGSHVLSALSHNVGTMPDDRVLYQYIQHRMDYIATATTEFPQWATPTMFVASLMKNFYAQKHLLDYISRSEGLKAYKFQERNLDDAARMNQHGTIRIFLRKFFRLNELKESVELPEPRQLVYDINGEPWSIYHFFGEKSKMFRRIFSTDKRTQYEVSESGGTAKFLEYDERFSPNWKQDVRIAVPGGIVGQHAFYTIIENVIRNAAKHGWSTEQNLREKDLEIYIDFGEDCQTGSVVFTIGDNVSDIFGPARPFWDDFFASFDSLEKWCTFINEDTRAELRSAIKKQADEEDSPWGSVSSVIDHDKSKVRSEVSKEEVARKKRLNIEEVIVRVFCTWLNDKESQELECYLSAEKKDTPVEDEEIRKLPLMYWLQREFLVTNLLLHNVNSYVEEAGTSEKVDVKWRVNTDVQGDIISAIIQPQQGHVSDFGILLAKDKEFSVWCGKDKQWDAIYKLLVECLDYRDGDGKKLSQADIDGRVLSIDSTLHSAINLKKITPARFKELGMPCCLNREEDCLEYVITKYLQWRIPDGWKYKKYLSTNNPQFPDWRLGRRLILPLHHDQHRKLAQSFIKSDGTLRSENWGLAEMKISAGYLAHRDIAEIGGLDEKGNCILTPVAMPGVCRNADNPHNCMACSIRDKRACYNTAPDCPLRTNRFHLGYRFSVEKPRDMLIVLDESDCGNLSAGVISKFQENGIYFAHGKSCVNGVTTTTTYYGIDNKEITTFSYRYVAFAKELTEADTSYHKFGFRRVLLNADVKIALDDEEQGLLAYVKNIKGGDVITNKVILGIRRAILSAWIRELRSSVGLDETLGVKLILNVSGNENGRERGLVTTKDLLQTMFVECYHTALISFIKKPPESIGLSDTACHLIMLLSLIKVLPEAMVKPQENYGHGADYGAKEYIRAQLIDYCDKLKSGLLLSVQFVDALKSIERYVKDEDGKGDAIITRDIEAIDKNFEKAIARRLFRAKLDEDEVVRKRCEELVKFLRKVDKEELDHLLDAFHEGASKYYCTEKQDTYKPGHHSFEDNLRAVVKACSVPEEYEFDALVESLNSMFLASDVYLRKYEERIATLPEAYKHDGGERKRANDSSGVATIQQIVSELFGCKSDENSEATSGGECKIIKYSRHDRSKPDNAIYVEALSGSQSYLNALSRLASSTSDSLDDLYGRYAGVARLLENAFLRILIIDERVMNFVNDRASDEMMKTFINMGIWVADVQKPQQAQDRSTVYVFEHNYEVQSGAKILDIPGDDRNRQFDILIIHQGIIDKWWGQAKHDPERVKEILDNIRKECHIPWVVVTTGRGRPENIPDDEKVLPFSVIESSLFRRYPEKLILVNTIMNLLPYGKKDKTT